MNQCLNKLLESLDHINQLKYLLDEEQLDHQFEGQQYQSQNYNQLIIHQNNHYFCTLDNLIFIFNFLKIKLDNTSTPVFAQSQSIYRRAESEKNFRQYMIPNLGDTIYKVDSYSRDISLLNLFEDKQEQEQYQNLNLQDIHKKRNKLQTIIEENKIYSNNHEGYQSQNQSQQITKQQQQLSNSNLHIEKQQLPNVNFQELDENEQFYSIIDNTVKITQSEQFFSIIDRSSFRLSFNIQYSQK